MEIQNNMTKIGFFYQSILIINFCYNINGRFKFTIIFIFFNYQVNLIILIDVHLITS